MATGFPVLFNIDLWAGNSGTAGNAAGFVFDIEAFSWDGSEIVFRAVFADGSEIRKTSANGGIAIDPETQRVTIPFAVADSRKVAAEPNKQAAYEIERRINGGEWTVAAGFLTARGGVNDDS